ncbi:hypothetical protein H9P43_001190 [Blastocladiella emersonii ATCC 22665]|nr:hypothetical protein H9P43_001190 [Blastocladiella emersonii ATCC 22665]
MNRGITPRRAAGNASGTQRKPRSTWVAPAWPLAGQEPRSLDDDEIIDDDAAEELSPEVGHVHERDPIDEDLRPAPKRQRTSLTGPLASAILSARPAPAVVDVDAIEDVIEEDSPEHHDADEPALTPPFEMDTGEPSPPRHRVWDVEGPHAGRSRTFSFEFAPSISDPPTTRTGDEDDVVEEEPPTPPRPPPFQFAPAPPAATVWATPGRSVFQHFAEGPSTTRPPNFVIPNPAPRRVLRHSQIAYDDGDDEDDLYAEIPFVRPGSGDDDDDLYLQQRREWSGDVYDFEEEDPAAAAGYGESPVETELDDPSAFTRIPPPSAILDAQLRAQKRQRIANLRPGESLDHISESDEEMMPLDDEAAPADNGFLPHWPTALPRREPSPEPVRPRFVLPEQTQDARYWLLL